MNSAKLNTKEKVLEWIIRPERYYINKYLSFLRKEEYFTFTRPIRFIAFWYKAKKNRLGARLGFIINAGCFDEGLKLERFCYRQSESQNREELYYSRKLLHWQQWRISG